LLITRGDPVGNQILSEKRAKAVRSHLRSLGISPEQVELIGVGAKEGSERPIKRRFGAKTAASRSLRFASRNTEMKTSIMESSDTMGYYLVHQLLASGLWGIGFFLVGLLIAAVLWGRTASGESATHQQPTTFG